MRGWQEYGRSLETIRDLVDMATVSLRGVVHSRMVRCQRTRRTTFLIFVTSANQTTLAHVIDDGVMFVFLMNRRQFVRN